MITLFKKFREYGKEYDKNFSPWFLQSYHRLVLAMSIMLLIVIIWLQL